MTTTKNYPTAYDHKSGKLRIGYQDGILFSIMMQNEYDKIDFDGLKHEVEFFESELNIENWIKL